MKKQKKKEAKERKKQAKLSAEDKDELDDDYKMLKKMKKGLIDGEKFDQHFGCEISDEDNE